MSSSNATANTQLSPFHLAIPVADLPSSRRFYGEVLGCPEGRSDATWVDFDFFGHQLVCHQHPDQKSRNGIENPVDGHQVPVPHFGIVLDMDTWTALAERLKTHDMKFTIEPYIRFAGQPGEQGTMFLQDPSGNALEFKAFRNMDNLFAK